MSLNVRFIPNCLLSKTSQTNEEVNDKPGIAKKVVSAVITPFIWIATQFLSLLGKIYDYFFVEKKVIIVKEADNITESKPKAESFIKGLVRELESIDRMEGISSIKLFIYPSIISDKPDEYIFSNLKENIFSEIDKLDSIHPSQSKLVACLKTNSDELKVVTFVNHPNNSISSIETVSLEDATEFFAFLNLGGVEHVIINEQGNFI